VLPRKSIFLLSLDEPGNKDRTDSRVPRAGGSWLWLLTPVMVSSIAMNLPEQVIKPAVSLVSTCAQRCRRWLSDLGAEPNVGWITLYRSTAT